MKKFFRAEKGVVSIYLIIILTVVFFFNAVLIDYARVMAAKKEAEAIAKSSLRSVLSAYDTELLKQYGLFGVTSGNEGELFAEVVTLNIDNSEAAFNFSNLNIDLESISLTKDHQLAYHQVFERQILEDMKYQAPINITEELIEQLASFTELMEEGANTSKTLNDLTDLYNTRQNLLKETFEYQGKSADVISTSNSFSEIEAIVNGYDNYLADLEEYQRLSEGKKNKETEEKLEKLRDSIANYKEQASRINDINRNFKNSQHQAYLQLAEEKLLEAKKTNEEIRKKANAAKKDPTNNNDINSLREITNDLDMIAYDDIYFDDIHDSIRKQSTIYDEMTSIIGNLTNEINSAINNPSINANQSMMTSLQQLNSLDSNYQKTYIEKGNQIDNGKRKLAEQEQDLNKKIKNSQEDAESSINAIKRLFDTMEQIKAESEDMKVVNKYENEYLMFNNKSLNAENQVSDVNRTNRDSVDLATDSMGEFSNLISSLDNMLIEFRDVIYVNEYAYTSFNHFDPTILKETVSSSSSQGNNENDGYSSINIDSNNFIEALDINNQEVEYIIYGSDTLSSNVALALRDIFLIRLAIRTLEGFFDPKVRALGHPLAIFAGAVAYGASHGTKDILQIIDGEQVEFSKFTKQLTFNYQDYLRFLLLLHNDHEGKLARMQALIHFNTNNDLKDIPTYIEASYTASINLWFLPGVIKGLSLTNLLDGNVVGDKYIFPKTAVLGY